MAACSPRQRKLCNIPTRWSASNAQRSTDWSDTKVAILLDLNLFLCFLIGRRGCVILAFFCSASVRRRSSASGGANKRMCFLIGVGLNMIGKPMLGRSRSSFPSPSMEYLKSDFACLNGHFKVTTMPVWMFPTTMFGTWVSSVARSTTKNGENTLSTDGTDLKRPSTVICLRCVFNICPFCTSCCRAIV